MTIASFETSGETNVLAVLQFDPGTGREQFENAREQFRSIVSDGHREVVIDLEGVHSVSSDLINFLLMCEMECVRGEVRLVVSNVDEEMLRSFRFSGLNQVIEFRT